MLTRKKKKKSEYEISIKKGNAHTQHNLKYIKINKQTNI